MRLDVDSYLARRFHLRRQNCWHLARDAWLELTGRDLGDRTPETLTQAALEGRFQADVPAFELLPGPAEPSLVLMRSPGIVPHVGVHYRARVLQMTVNGASYLPVAQACAGYRQTEFYR